MERYRQKTALASAADHLLRVLIAWAAGVGWFVALWGLCLPALTAGTALGGLFWLCARLLGKKQVQKKEAALRRTLGGELALEKLLLSPPAEAASHTLLKEQLDEVLTSLTEREAKVLRLRFGLEDGRPRTLEEVGKEFDVTRERIRQIEAKALRKLRHPSRSKKLKDFLD